MTAENLAPEVTWFILGLLLLGLEMLTGTFVVLFFACGALVIALVAWLGLVTSAAAQIFLFALLSGGGLLAFRDRIRRGWGGPKEHLRGDVHQEILVESAVADGADFEVSYQGARWAASNQCGRSLVAGERVKIAKVEGVKLVVKE
jgi:membrane protein implicated in regulation of membrane protease activity